MTSDDATNEARYAYDVNTLNPGYYGSADLREMGFRVGDNVLVAKNCTIIGADGGTFENIEIGSNVRIDGFSTIIAASGTLKLGSYIHIGGYCFLSCRGNVELADFSGLSQRVSIYSASDDYSGRALTNPTVPHEYLKVKIAPVKLGRHVIVGSGTVILPGVEIGEGSSIGALSLVRKSLPEWGIFAGNPAVRIMERSRQLLEAERRLQADV